MDPKHFEDMAKKFSDLMPEGVKSFQKDFEEQVKKIMQQTFAKMDLVTKDEFEVQQQVLLKTRQKVEMMEEKVKILEEKLGLSVKDSDNGAK